MADAITSQHDDYSQWYVDVVRAAGLAEYSPVRGSMIIPPNGYALWENMQRALDGMFKATGHQNAYFPLFIPQSFLAKEAAHVEGFAKECAIVTHYRLTTNEDGELIVDPDAKLEEPLIVRPTSETIIWDAYSRWIQSWRDLPILINQWANVVRWEMRTRLFLRTAEFLWQEGHTAHATEQEAVDEARQMLDVYATFAEDWMAMPVIKGAKTASERFPGAVDTFAIEALMQDGKALQAGTSHFLGQNFAKAFNCMFTNKDNEQEYVWATSWGVSTRLVGGLVMTHGDDQGLVLPPRLAPTQVVVVPIYRANKEDDKQAVMEVVERIERELRVAGVRVKVDAREEHRPGWKFHEYEVQGVPLRLAVGPRDVQNGQVELSRRDQGGKEFVPLDTLASTVTDLLSQIQRGLFNKAASFRDSKTTKADSYDEFKDAIEQGGFVLAHWDGTAETEARIKEETKATIRVVPFERDDETGKDMLTGEPSDGRVLFARSY
jgi:prolyl-tRNA synthetase